MPVAPKLLARKFTPEAPNLCEYIEAFCKRSRRHSTLGYSSPVQFLQDWISKHVDQQSMAA